MNFKISYSPPLGFTDWNYKVYILDIGLEALIPIDDGRLAI